MTSSVTLSAATRQNLLTLQDGIAPVWWTVRGLS